MGGFKQALALGGKINDPPTKTERYHINTEQRGRAYHLDQVPLPGDYPEGVPLPASSSIAYPDGLLIIVDFTNTERYKNQGGN